MALVFGLANTLPQVLGKCGFQENGLSRFYGFPHSSIRESIAGRTGEPGELWAEWEYMERAELRGELGLISLLLEICEAE